MKLMTEEKKGLKKTDVGLIPEDWEVYELGDLGSFKNGINKGKDSFGHGSPFVNLMDVFGIRSISDTKKLKLVDTNSSEKSNYSLQKGDVLFVRSSVKPSGVGLTTLIDDDLEEAVYSGFLIRFRENGIIYHDYKAYCFHEPGFRDRLIAKSSVSANTNINQDSLKVLKISLPPTLTEQQAIASALSDVDELILSLNRLIQKKQVIKKGTMQQLLTGKNRLPEFDGEWEVKKIGEITSINTGSKNTEDKVEDGKYPFFVRSSKEERINSYSFDGEAVLTAGDGVGTGKIFHYINGKFDYHQRVYKMSDFTSIIDGYYFYLYFSTHFYDRVMGMTAKSSVDSVRMDMIAEMHIELPPIEEQKAIAQILSDMDRELQALRQKREKYVQIKQGMMQQLLTGRIRI